MQPRVWVNNRSVVAGSCIVIGPVFGGWSSVEAVHEPLVLYQWTQAEMARSTSPSRVSGPAGVLRLGDVSDHATADQEGTRAGRGHH
jgi:hypothetical protein